MPSLRVLSIAALAVLGAVAGVLGGGGDDGDRPAASRPAPSATARISAAGPAAFDPRAENARPGTAGWRIAPRVGTAPGVRAWASSASVTPGQDLTLHVAADGAATVEVLRIGWYGGAGAREITRATASGHPADGAAPADWPSSGTITTDGWPPGHYLLKVERGAAARYVPLTVRSTTTAGAVLLVTTPLGWAAGTGTLDAPYPGGYGAGGFLGGDLALVQLAERDGDDLAYATDGDVARDPSLAADATAVVFGGGSRSWTRDLRTAVIGAVRHGVNAAFFGAGTGSARVDAEGRTVTVPDDAPRAGGSLTGLVPACAEASSARRAGTVADADWWGFRRTGVTAGQALPGLVQSPDALDPAVRAARPLDVVASGPAGCGGAGWSSVWWADRSGSGVFAAGTERWVCIAGDTCLDDDGRPRPVDRTTRRVVTRTTRLVLLAVSHPGAGKAYPPR